MCGRQGKLINLQYQVAVFLFYDGLNPRASNDLQRLPTTIVYIIINLIKIEVPLSSSYIHNEISPAKHEKLIRPLLL